MQRTWVIVFIVLSLVLTLHAHTPLAHAKIELGFSNPPDTINDQEPFTVEISIDGASTVAEYYIRGVFYKPESTQYFGFTQNNRGDWHSDQSVVTQFAQLTGNEKRLVSFKVDSDSPFFEPDTQYHFKVGRYTPAGSLTWSDQTPATLYIRSSSSSATPVLPPPDSTPTPSPTVALSVSPTPHSSPVTAISLSEVMACPSANQSELIELYNSSQTEILIQSWILKDSSEKHAIPINGTLYSGEYLAVQLPYSIFNNTGDQVRVFSDQNTLVDQMSFDFCQDGNSFIPHDGTWLTTELFTPGRENILKLVPTTPPAQIQLSKTPEITLTSIEDESDPSKSSQLDEFGITQFPEVELLSQEIPLASLSSITSSEQENIATKTTAIAEAPSHTSPKMKFFASGLSSTVLFVLAGCCYLLSAAILTQKWYNLVSGL